MTGPSSFQSGPSASSLKLGTPLIASSRKARVVAELVAMLLDAGESLAPSYSAEFGAREKILAKAEIGAYWLYVVDKIAFRLLSPSERDEFVSTLEESTIEKLSEMGMNRSEFARLVQARYAEYSAYKK